MKYRKFAASCILGLTILTHGALGDSSPRGTPARAVVELFTSQGCSSCPPADELLQELINRSPDVVALEFHVDYWDDLVYGSAGQWRDPFSSAEYTARQREYHAKPLRGRRGVYTPQMIMNGHYALVGTQRDVLNTQLRRADRLPLDVSISRHDDGLKAQFQGQFDGAADIWQVNFISSANTPVAAGENNGKVLANHHIVTGMTHLARWWGQSPELELASLKGSATGCAVLVQQPTGKIVGASYCPL